MLTLQHEYQQCFAELWEVGHDGKLGEGEARIQFIFPPEDDLVSRCSTSKHTMITTKL